MEKVGYQARPLRHLPSRKRSPDPAAAVFFSLYLRVMREGLSTAPAAGPSGSGLSGGIFSGPDDCADLVNSFQRPETIEFFERAPEHFDASGVRRDGTDIEPFCMDYASPIAPKSSGFWGPRSCCADASPERGNGASRHARPANAPV